MVYASYDTQLLMGVGRGRKCAKWVVGKKSAAGDKAAARRHERPLLWERLPFAAVPVLTGADVEAQRTRVRVVRLGPCSLTDNRDSSLTYGMKMD